MAGEGGIGRFLTVRKRKSGLTPSISHESTASHDSHSAKELHKRTPLPVLATPLNKNALVELTTVGSRTSFHSSKDGHSEVKLYKTHHEATTIELYYDLFFVGNLASFTAMQQHIDGESIRNYIGFFTMLWFTWLSTTLFDVRFNTESIIDRCFKMIHFAVMAAFVFCGPIFDAYEKVEDHRAIEAFALVMTISRATLGVQYVIVMLQSRKYKRAMIPLGVTALVEFTAAAGFLSTYYVENNKLLNWSLYVAWYVISIASGLLNMGVALFFRMINFRHSHLIERVGLLTLIVMGEGVLGMIKAILCVTKGQNTNNGTEIGTICAAIILLYLVWMLYFDQIDHERFGEVRQHIWVLLHYPLHVALLLCVEGSTALLVWNSSVQGLKFVWSRQPADLNNPAAAYNNVTAFVSGLDSIMNEYEKRFKSYSLKKSYNWNVNLTYISNLNSTFKSSEWNAKVVPVVDKMFDYSAKFVFMAHKATMEKMIRVVPTDNQDSEFALMAVYKVFDVVTMFFFIASGGFLLLLAIMYWFGKVHKGKSELGEIVGRVVVGFVLIMIGTVAVLNDKSLYGFKYEYSYLLIPIVVLGFFMVVAFDQILLRVSGLRENKRNKGYVSTSPPNEDAEDVSLVDSYKGGVNVETTEFKTYMDHHHGQQFTSPTAMPPQPYDEHFKSGSTPPPTQQPVGMGEYAANGAHQLPSYDPTQAYQGRTRGNGYARIDADD